MKKLHTIHLSRREKQSLQIIIRKGTRQVRVISRAQILLKSAQGLTDKEIMRHIGSMSERTIQRVRERFCNGGIDQALYDNPRSGRPTAIKEKEDAFIVATACSKPPEGVEHWTLELLQDRLRKKQRKRIGTATIWRHLTNRGIKPWREKNVVHTESYA